MGLRLKCLILAAGFTAFCTLQSAPEVAVVEGIVVKVKGLRNTGGQVLASLFKSAKGFPSDGARAFRTRKMSIGQNREVLVVFTNVPAGKYAVAVCHDENGNNRLDSSSWGIPKEGTAVYKESDVKLGPPSFESSVFDFTNKALNAEISIVYH